MEHFDWSRSTVERKYHKSSKYFDATLPPPLPKRLSSGKLAWYLDEIIAWDDRRKEVLQQIARDNPTS